jgi:hypothetical protein
VKLVLEFVLLTLQCSVGGKGVNFVAATYERMQNVLVLPPLPIHVITRNLWPKTRRAGTTLPR